MRVRDQQALPGREDAIVIRKARNILLFSSSRCFPPSRNELRGAHARARARNNNFGNYLGSVAKHRRARQTNAPTVNLF